MRITQIVLGSRTGLGPQVVKVAVVSDALQAATTILVTVLITAYLIFIYRQQIRIIGM